jgi:2-hydroxy-6-oxonona-2,4-dienedioate hydrolase
VSIYESSSRTVRVNSGSLQDFSLHFNDIGQGRPVVMLHGSGPGASGWSNFSRNVDAFVASGHRVILIDLPGWGRSDTVVVKTGNRIPINVDAVVAVLDALHIERAHVLGNSMGGATALKFAIQHPTRCEKLVVMGGGAGGQSLFVPMPSEGIKSMLAAYRQPSLESLKRMMNVFVFDPKQISDELVESRFQAMQDQSAHIESFVTSMGANPKHLMAEFADQLASVKAKTLVVWGRDDRCVPLDAGLRLTWALPDAQLHVFSRCGHWAQWEHADEFNRLSTGFLEDQVR